MKATFNLKAGGEVFPIKRVFLPVLGLFQNNRSLLTADEYEVRAQVPPSVVQTFVQIVQGAEPDLSEGTCKALRLLGEEFQFEALTAECAAFEALHQPACEATTETVTAALEKRVSHLEEQSLIMERGSELVEKTVRSLCDQLAFVDSEVRRLSEVCDGLMNKPGPPDTEDNLTSAASDRPLSANQGRILNEKIAVIAGYFESGSEKTAKLAQKPEPLRTISVDLSGFVRGSGRTSYDGSGSITIAIATQTPRTFDGEQAYRRGCECLYEANTFGPRGEEMARTLGLSLLKQSAELGNSDGQYRYGRCLLYGDGCEKDTISGVEYLKESAEQGNSWAEAEYGKCLLVPDRSGVARDIDRGVQYLRRSVEKSNPRGQTFLGSCLEKGIGMEKDLVLAAECYRHSADQGNSDGQYHFGRCLENGIGIEKDLIRAAECYRHSADRGNSDGQYHFGRCLENGIGIEKDLVRAEEYYRSCGVYRHSGSFRSIMIPSWVLVLDQWSFAPNKSLGSLESVTFENGSRLEFVRQYAFQGSGLKSIVIPFSVIVLGNSCFYSCKSLESVTFERGCRLERIEEFAFSQSGLKSIVIPSSVVVLSKESFCRCESLQSVKFESGCRLERIEESAFRGSGLKSISVPSSVVSLGIESFCQCESLRSVTFENGSRLERIEESMFEDTHVSFGLVSQELTRSKKKARTQSKQGAVKVRAARAG